MKQPIIFFGIIMLYIHPNVARSNGMITSLVKNDRSVIDVDIPQRADTEIRSHIKSSKNVRQKRYSSNYKPHPNYRQTYRDRMDYGNEDPHMKGIINYLEEKMKNITQPPPIVPPPQLVYYPFFLPLVLEPICYLRYLCDNINQIPECFTHKQRTKPVIYTQYPNVIPLTKTITSTEMPKISGKKSKETNNKKETGTTEQPSYIKNNMTINYKTSTEQVPENKTVTEIENDYNSNSLDSIIKRLFKTSQNNETSVSNNDTNASPNPTQPNVTTRIFLEDKYQNWGIQIPVENNDDYEDNNRPISFEPIKPETPLYRSPPPVEHGTSQVDASNNPSKTTSQTYEATTTKSFMLSDCDKAIFLCCNQNPITLNCFAVRNCPNPFYGKSFCDQKIVASVYQKITNYYGRIK